MRRTVTTVCSLIVNGPVFSVHRRPKVLKIFRGTTLAQKQPIGYTSLVHASVRLGIEWTAKPTIVQRSLENLWPGSWCTVSISLPSPIKRFNEQDPTNLMLKNMLSPLPMVTKIMPSTQARMVLAGSPLSVLRTAARTSSYGESSAKASSISLAISVSDDRAAS